MSSERISATRRIAAPASKIFQIVSSPDGHIQIDGSGMLEAAPDAKPLTEVGDTFDMDMDRTPLNDIPGLVKYKVRNTVTQFVPDRLIEWTVGSADRPPLGHVYGWQIEPVSDTEAAATLAALASIATLVGLREILAAGTLPRAVVIASHAAIQPTATGELVAACLQGDENRAVALSHRAFADVGGSNLE